MRNRVRLADLPAHVRVQIQPTKKARRTRSALQEPNEMFALHLKTSPAIPPVQREFYFHDSRKWRSDFAWPEHLLLVEIEGGTMIQGGGRHNRGLGFQNDCEKYLAAFELGYHLLRFTTKMVKDLTALRAIERFFARTKAPFEGKS